MLYYYIIIISIYLLSANGYIHNHYNKLMKRTSLISSTSLITLKSSSKIFSDDNDDDDIINSSIDPILIIEQTEKDVGIKLCKILEEEYNKSIQQKGSFVFCISGGSMIKMLENMKDINSNIDWSKSIMGFVSHRCVPLDDNDSSYYKSKPAFLDSWIKKGLKVITVTGSSDSQKEALHFEEQMMRIPDSILPKNGNGYPVFDLLLIGLGNDGHIGSIYPNKADVYSQRICVPATSENGKISLSLKAMEAAKTKIVACAGRSSKAPLGKAQAMVLLLLL